MLGKISEAFVESVVVTPGSNRMGVYKDMVASILSFVIAVVIVAFVGKFLWNETVAELFTFARPVRSVWQIIGLMILISLFK